MPSTLRARCNESPLDPTIVIRLVRFSQISHARRRILEQLLRMLLECPVYPIEDSVPFSYVTLTVWDLIIACSPLTTRDTVQLLGSRSLVQIRGG
jgi:hypothetical protein